MLRLSGRCKSLEHFEPSPNKENAKCAKIFASSKSR